MNLMLFHKICNFPPLQLCTGVVLAYPAAKFYKTDWHSDSISYNRKIGQASILLTDSKK